MIGRSVAGANTYFQQLLYIFQVAAISPTYRSVRAFSRASLAQGHPETPGPPLFVVHAREMRGHEIDEGAHRGRGMLAA